MKKPIAFNKMMLGALTMGDLHEIVKDHRGENWREAYREYSVGEHWLPISSVRRRQKAVMLWMQDIGDADIIIPLDTSVKVKSDLVTVSLEGDRIKSSFWNSVIELCIRLDFEPFQRSEK